MRRAVYLLAAALAVSCGNHQISTSSFEKQFNRYCSTTVEEWQVPGLAAVVVKDGQIVFLKGYGVTKHANDGQPVNPSTTQFVLASTTKAFTGALLARVIDETDNLDWEDRVVEHLPGFKMNDPWITEHMKVGEVNSHHNGWGEYALDDLPFFGYDRDELTTLFPAIKPTRDFRRSYGYNNEMYSVSAQIIEKYTNLSWDDAMAEMILKPLKMNHSTTGVKAYRESPDLAYGYRVHYDSDADSLYLEPRDDRDDAATWLSAVAPAAFVITTAEDMANWLQMHLGHGVFQGDTIISRQNHDYLFKPQSVSSFTDEHIRTYGQGWGVEQNRKGRYIRHTGLAYGYTSLVGLVPELQLGFAFLCNNGQTSSCLEGLGKKVIDLYLGEKNSPDYAHDYFEKFKENERKSAARKKEAKQEICEPMTLPLSAYTGRYRQEQLGTARIFLKDGELWLQLKDVNSPLTHQSADIFSYHVPGAGHFKLEFKLKGSRAASLELKFDCPMEEFRRI